jgi:hypothetical protein
VLGGQAYVWNSHYCNWDHRRNFLALSFRLGSIPMLVNTTGPFKKVKTLHSSDCKANGEFAEATYLVIGNFKSFATCS